MRHLANLGLPGAALAAALLLPSAPALDPVDWTAVADAQEVAEAAMLHNGAASAALRRHQASWRGIVDDRERAVFERDTTPLAEALADEFAAALEAKRAAYLRLAFLVDAGSPCDDDRRDVRAVRDPVRRALSEM